MSLARVSHLRLVARPAAVRCFSSAAPAAAKPGIVDRAKEIFGISKEHTKAAMKNQSQAVDDISAGRATASDELKEHGKAAKRDMKQWGQEIKEAATGDKLPGSAKVRDMPPRVEGEKVRDNIKEVPRRGNENIRKM
jgi:hypothetical protein